MDEEVSFEYDGSIYSCTYCVQGDDLFVYLPDGSQRTTNLRGLDPAMAALTHLRSFVRSREKLSGSGSDRAS